jgi:hypothetical protein
MGLTASGLGCGDGIKPALAILFVRHLPAEVRPKAVVRSAQTNQRRE